MIIMLIMSTAAGAGAGGTLRASVIEREALLFARTMLTRESVDTQRLPLPRLLLVELSAVVIGVERIGVAGGAAG